MASIRYIFLDLDGTLLYTDKRVSMKTVAYLRDVKQRYNLQLGIATGRAPTSVKPLLKHYGIEDVFDVVIANNGVDTIGSNDKPTYHEGMITIREIAYILKKFEPYPEITIAFHNPDVVYATNVTRRVHNILKMNHMHLVLDPRKDHGYQAAARVMLLFHPVYRRLVEDAVAIHPIPELKGYFAEEDIYEFTRKEVSKHKAMETYVKQFGDTLDNVMVFGDSGNDIGMLTSCGIGVVMKNAQEDIKPYGNKVTAYTNDEDGIYEFLRRHEDLLKG